MKLRDVRHWLDHWALRTAPPHVLAIFRIAFGLFLLLYWGLRLPHVPMMFSVEGLLLPNIPGLAPSWMQTLFHPTPLWAWITYAAMMTSLVLFTVGALFRPATFVAIVLYFYYWQLSLHLLPTSFDRLFGFTFFVLLFSGADRTFSLRMWWREGSWMAWEPISVLPQRILALQITATYWGVGWQKMVLPDWQGGEMLPYSFVGTWGTPVAYWMVRQNWPMEFYDWSVLTVMAFEFFLPFGLWVPGWRWFFYAGGLIFHSLIWIFLDIWWFMVLVPAYIVFFEPEAIAVFLQKMAKKRIRGLHLPAVTGYRS